MASFSCFLSSEKFYFIFLYAILNPSTTFMLFSLLFYMQGAFP
ncbi:hypothetical protein HMPREF1548_01141 [Clostridium sp. KLE 1755]|nr:hypothetical protein HMPREF1548_01141 [Clostridium sp. KLE 1755]